MVPRQQRALASRVTHLDRFSISRLFSASSRKRNFRLLYSTRSGVVCPLKSGAEHRAFSLRGGTTVRWKATYASKAAPGKGRPRACSASLLAERAFRLQPLILGLRQMETCSDAGLESAEILVLLLFAADGRAEHISGASVHGIVPDDHTAIWRTCPSHSEEQEL